MPRKRFAVEQIINHLREADVLLAQGRTVGGDHSSGMAKDA
jgi:hypothetical protein